MEGKIISSLIAYNDTILVEYNYLNSGLTQNLEESVVNKIKRETSGIMPVDDAFNVSYLNENNITYALLADKAFKKERVIGFISSIKKVFELNFPEKKFENIPKYGLNSQFKEKLIEKTNLFNDNPDLISEEILEEKKKMMKLKDELFYDQQLVDRSNKIKEMEMKAEDLHMTSDSYKKAAIARKKKKCLIF